MAHKTFSSLDMARTPASSVMIAPDPASITNVKPRPSIKTVGFIGFNSLVKAILHGIAGTRGPVKKPERLGPGTQILVSVQPGESDHEPVQDGFLAELAKKGVRPQLMQGDNDTLARRSDLIILATLPESVKTVLTQPRMADALSGKVLVSLVPGVTVAQMKEVLFSEDRSMYPLEAPSPCTIFRARPNSSASVAKSITSIALSAIPPPQEAKDLVFYFFSSLGTVTYVPESEVDAAAVVAAVTPAYISLLCEAIIDGAVASGMTRRQADKMATQALAEIPDMFVNKMKISWLREKLCTDPGNAIEAVIALDKAGIKGKVSMAIWDCISADISQDRKGSWRS